MPLSPKKTLLIGIAGASGAGKSYYTRTILAELNGEASVLCIDSYYKKQSHLPMSERVKQNYDHPNALDFTLLQQHLQQLRAGAVINHPVYDYSVHDRTGQTSPLIPTDIVLIEGALLFAFPPILNLLDYKIYIDTPDDLCFIRRLQRDTRERGRSVDSIIDQYLNSVRPMLKQYVIPFKTVADIIVSGEQFDKNVFAKIIKEIQTMRNHAEYR